MHRCGGCRSPKIAHTVSPQLKRRVKIALASSYAFTSFHLATGQWIIVRNRNSKISRRSYFLFSPAISSRMNLECTRTVIGMSGVKADLIPCFPSLPEVDEMWRIDQRFRNIPSGLWPVARENTIFQSRILVLSRAAVQSSATILRGVASIGESWRRRGIHFFEERTDAWGRRCGILEDNQLLRIPLEIQMLFRCRLSVFRCRYNFSSCWCSTPAIFLSIALRSEVSRLLSRCCQRNFVFVESNKEWHLTRYRLYLN